VEAVDPVFQTNMLDMLKQTGRPEMVVGWYHSHPGFGCWLSGVDMNTQTSFEQLNARAVAVVVDPVQSVKGKVVIDAFRMIAGQGMMMMMAAAPPTEPRQTTSNVGFLKKPTIQARIHGLDRHYYSLVIDWRKNDLEEQMLMNLHKKDWSAGLLIKKFEDHQTHTEAVLDDMTRLSKDYYRRVKEEEGRTAEEVEIMNVGKIDPKRHLESNVNDLMASSILQCLGTMIDTVIF
jgi:26S proteasome regulatory subunit N11